ncbi:hypothetical protein PR048_000264 [Dryococelus australis]|uniref:Reverse transcriptase domain-containing protein n=1 Tax=Dryococelus australis TaxID=614101 RepID=A0ABQ9IE69_9NEOP|nr:hypothetical protein PR048_000264 [Dryococelus australis]
MGTFREKCKKGLLTLIYKGGGKNPIMAKSYRPIMLLSVMGNTLEHLINKILMEYLDAVEGIHPRQNGFMKGKSTEKSVIDMVNQVRSYDQTYMCRRYPWIYQKRLTVLGVHRFCGNYACWSTPGTFRVIKDFMADRICVLEMGNHREEKALSRGCPQGPLLSPILWNMIFEGLLRLYLPQGCVIFGYADDRLLLIPAWSRSELERKMEIALKRVDQRDKNFKL